MMENEKTILEALRGEMLAMKNLGLALSDRQIKARNYLNSIPWYKRLKKYWIFR